MKLRRSFILSLVFFGCIGPVLFSQGCLGAEPKTSVPDVVFWTGTPAELDKDVPRPAEVLSRPGWTPGLALVSPDESSTPPKAIDSVSAPSRSDSHVSLLDKGTHFEVVLDFTNGASRFDVGAEYGAKIKQAVPDYEKLLDSYLSEGSMSGFIYHILLRRVKQMKSRLPKEYRDEIEGIASRLSGGKHSKRNDGKISVDELYLLNLLGDVCRLNSCCAVTVYGEKSCTGHPLVGRNLDWPDGRQNQMAQLHAVVTMKTGMNSISSVACLGFQAVATGVNSQGVFAGVLDSATGTKFSAARKYSYLFDLRKALEEQDNIEGVKAAMTRAKRRYTFNHVIMLADRNKAGVLENNFTGTGGHMQRALRTASSELHPEVVWDVPDAVGAVNWFMLKGNHDNRIDPLDKYHLKKGKQPGDRNSKRWDSMREQLKALGAHVDMDGLKKVITFSQNGGSMYKGDLYNYFTMQAIVFDPQSLKMEIAFRPKNGIRNPKPAFERVALALTDTVPSPSAVAPCDTKASVIQHLTRLGDDFPLLP